MSEQNTTLDVFYQNWENYQNLLRDALEPLTPEQLALSAAGNERTIERLAVHIIAVRVRWLGENIGVIDEATAPLAEWDRSNAPVRTAAELTMGFDMTRQMLADNLARWTSRDMAQEFPDEEDGETFYLSRSWIVWHLIEHDLHHGGEISLTLGMHGLQGVGI